MSSSDRFLPPELFLESITLLSSSEIALPPDLLSSSEIALPPDPLSSSEITLPPDLLSDISLIPLTHCIWVF